MINSLIVALLSIVLAIIVAFDSRSNAKPLGLPQSTVSLSMKQAGIRDSLEQLLKPSGMKYQIENDVKNDRKINIDVRGAKWADVFRFILNDASLSYQINRDGILIISQAK